MHPRTKFLAVVIVLFAAGGVWYLTQSQASTTLGLSFASNTTLNDGLVGHWTFDTADMDWGSTTAEVRDVSGNGYHGDAQGNLFATSSILGVMEQGMSFSTPTQWINMGTALDVPDLPLTVSAWVNPTSFTTYATIFSKRDTYASNDMRFNIMLCYSAGAQCVGSGTVLVQNGSSGVESSVAVPAGVWTLVTVVMNTGGIDVFFNGVHQESLSPLTLGTDSAAVVSVGNVSTFPGTGQYYGFLDDVRIYNRAFSAEEVLGLYDLTRSTHMASTLTSNPDLEEGLVGHWTMDGSDVDWSSTTAEVRDRSGNGNHGDAQGGMTTATSPTMGVLGQALKFDGDGDGDYLNAGSNSSVDDLETLSVCAWIKPDTIGEFYVSTGFYYGTIASKLYPGWWFGISDEFGSIRHYLYRKYNTSSGIWYPTSASVPLDEWTHVCVAHNGGTTVDSAVIYLNGASVTLNMQGSPSGGITSDNGNSVHIGTNDNGLQDFDGLMDDVRIYNRALSADEVKRLYELGATTRVGETLTSNPDLTSGLVGHWTMDGSDVDWGSTTAEIKDRSANNLHGDVSAGVDAGSATIGVIGQAITMESGVATTPPSTALETQNVTLSAWVNLPSVPNDYRYIVSKVDDTNAASYALYFGLSGTLFFYITNTSDSVFKTSDVVPDDTWINQWKHIVGTYDGLQLRIYVDGVQEGSLVTTQTIPFNSTKGVTLGNYDPDLFNSPLGGKLDDVRIYNRALSADEVFRLYELGR